MPIQPTTTYSDGGFSTGTTDVIIAGFAYTLQTNDHDLSVAQSDAMTAQGLPKGAAFVVQKQKLSVKIQAITGIPAPAQLVPFYYSSHNLPNNWWLVTNLKISSSNSSAAIRTYTADIVYLVNAPS